MAITTCSLNLPSSSSSPPPPLSTQSSKPNQVSCSRKSNGMLGTWRKQCAALVGMYCVVIASEAMLPSLGTEYWANAENNMQQQEKLQGNVEESKKNHPKRWSENRACPSWQVNSLEIVVPENLPRPSTRRLSQSATLRLQSLGSRKPSSCFTL